MRHEDFVPQPDSVLLRLENEVLVHEVSYLRGQVRALNQQLEDSTGIRPDAARDSKDAIELAEAKKDLRWTLSRLHAPPVGWLLRRRSGFQSLWSRWMEPPDHQ